MNDIETRLGVAAALRELNHAFVSHDGDIDRLRHLQATLEREAAGLRQGPRRDRAVLSAAAAREPGRDSGFEDRAVAGRANPTSILVDLAFEQGEVVASVVFGPACEGPPGRAHGGMVCAVFDDVTGFAISHLGTPAFTGELTVRYLAPIPIGEAISIRARLDGVDRRKLFISEEMSSGETVVAWCRATCISIAPPSEPVGP